MARAAQKKPKKETEEEPRSTSLGRRIASVTFRIAWGAVAWISAPILICGLLVRVTARDNVDAFAGIFYATPWAVLAVLAAICAVYWRARRYVFWVALALFLACATTWVVRDFRSAPAAKGERAFRVSYWNIARPEMRLNSVLAQSNQMEADFLVFGEHREGPKTPDRWTENFAGKSVLPMARELLFVSPEMPKREDGGSLGGAGGFQFYSAVVKGKRVYFLLVDFTASYGGSRQPAFDRLFQIVDAYAEKPLIVIGDFNTPSDSAHFDRLRKRLSSAFESAGHGYANTWPMPLPVLQLDHIWTNKHLRVLRCEHRTSFYSDHRAVVADVAFGE